MKFLSLVSVCWFYYKDESADTVWGLHYPLCANFSLKIKDELKIDDEVWALTFIRKHYIGSLLYTTARIHSDRYLSSTQCYKTTTERHPGLTQTFDGWSTVTSKTRAPWPIWSIVKGSMITFTLCTLLIDLLKLSLKSPALPYNLWETCPTFIRNYPRNTRDQWFTLFTASLSKFVDVNKRLVLITT